MPFVDLRLKIECDMTENNYELYYLIYINVLHNFSIFLHSFYKLSASSTKSDTKAIDHNFCKVSFLAPSSLFIFWVQLSLLSTF